MVAAGFPPEGGLPANLPEVDPPLAEAKDGQGLPQACILRESCRARIYPCLKF
jgi:hypothetical protein